MVVKGYGQDEGCWCYRLFSTSLSIFFYCFYSHQKDTICLPASDVSALGLTAHISLDLKSCSMWVERLLLFIQAQETLQTHSTMTNRGHSSGGLVCSLCNLFIGGLIITCWSYDAIDKAIVYLWIDNTHLKANFNVFLPVQDIVVGK